MSGGLLSINTAVAQGICRLRMPQWVNPLEHLKIDVVDGRPGAWAHLYSPSNISLNKRDPVDVLCISMPGLNRLHVDPYLKIYEPYTGPTHESQEYKDAQAKWIEDDLRLFGERF